jgi:hypothetical protein
LERSLVFGIRVIKPLLMKAEASPEFSMAVYAMRSEGATSLTQDWKNLMGILSCPGALFLGSARIALTTSSSVRLWVREALVFAKTLAGTLSQQEAWAS